MRCGAPLPFLAALVAVLVSPERARAQSGVPAPAEVPPSLASLPGREEPPAAARVPAKKDLAENVIVPIVLYTPETHFGFGALFVHFFRRPPEERSNRVSSLAFLAIATTRRQAIVEVHPDFYFFADDLHLFGKLEYQYFPDSFWGIGSQTLDEDEERYKRERFRLRGGAQHRIFGPLYGGIGFDVMEYRGTYATDGLFAVQSFPGERGGITAGIGPTAVFDTRDNAVAAHSGTLLGMGFLWFGRPVSRYTFRKFVLEARQFFPLGLDHAIGARFYGELQGGDVPYYQLAMLGGDELLRGYYLGRYRDETLAAVEAEYRFPLVWKFGGVLFAGAGEVAETLGDLPSEPVRWAVGGGLRFSLSDSERLNLRLDVGFGPGSWGLYFTAREAF